MHRFDRFMEAALYHPERGYYSSRIKSVGSRGDFTTTAQLSPLLGKAIAEAFLDSGLKHLIEVGPGTGLLSKTVRAHLPFFAKLRTQQHLVEVSAPLRKLQLAANPKASHHHSLSTALQEAGGRAFIFSNELVDAFPVRIFRKEEEGFSELHLAKKAGHVQEQFLPTTDLPDSTQFAEETPIGHRLEVHQSYQNWLNEHLSHLREGQLLTIDYALPEPPSPAGTLRGYLLQERITGQNLYQSAGHLDLTTDVAFGDLIAWSSPLGLETVSLQTQADFLNPFASESPADRFLTDPQGAGKAFQVLLQAKGTPCKNNTPKSY